MGAIQQAKSKHQSHGNNLGAIKLGTVRIEAEMNSNKNLKTRQRLQRQRCLYGNKTF